LGLPSLTYPSSRLFLGVDIGGTTISVVLVDDQGVPRGSAPGVQAEVSCDDHEIPVWWEPLGDDHDPRSVCQRVRKLAEAALGTAGLVLTDLSGVGICTPGLMDVRSGIVRKAANLAGWQQVAVCDILSEVLDVDRRIVALENDTNAALLAEAWIGAAKGCENAVLMTLGTGIGGALLCDGRLLRGSRGQAGEIGHAILVPDGRTWGGAGVEGIFESYASASAVAARAKEGDGRADGMPKDSSLSQLLKPADCATVFKNAQAGDAYAKSVVAETARYLGIGCINCCRFVDPDVILLAGGMAQAGDFLIEQVRDAFAAYHWNIEPLRVEIKRATLGAHSGAVGAARAALLLVDGIAS
jgi:glucokinase